MSQKPWIVKVESISVCTLIFPRDILLRIHWHSNKAQCHLFILFMNKPTLFTPVHEHLSSDRSSHVFKNLQASESCRTSCYLDCYSLRSWTLPLLGIKLRWLDPVFWGGYHPTLKSKLLTSPSFKLWPGGHLPFLYIQYFPAGHSSEPLFFSFTQKCWVITLFFLSPFKWVGRDQLLRGVVSSVFCFRNPSDHSAFFPFGHPLTGIGSAYVPFGHLTGSAN